MRSGSIVARRAWLFALCCSPLVAHAKATTELQYRLEEVFSTATRFVRVDKGCSVTDKDADAAFVMFECDVTEGPTKKVARGGIEIFRAKKDGRDAVRIQISLNDESHGTELRWLELLERKLRDERGTPAPPPKPTPAPKPPDMAPPPPF